MLCCSKPGQGFTLALATALTFGVASAAFYAPNRFLGTCLNDDWVRGKELELGVSASARDPDTKQLLYPFLHVALPGPRYTLVDTRTFNTSAYSPTCIPSGENVYGPDAVVDPSTGNVISIGHIAGSLVLEVNEGAVHRLNTMIFAIIASELIGYNVSIYYAPASTTIEKRLTFTDPQALCTPVHANVAMSTRLSFSKKAWAVLGDLGNRLIRGLYTTNDLVQDGEDPTRFPITFDADFWRDYARSEFLIEELAESNLRNNSLYFPPAQTYCKDGVYGCLNHCSKNYACTLREQQGKECLVVVATQSSATRVYYPALLANLGFPAYICYIGRSGLQAFVLDMLSQRKGVVFYMDYPDEFIIRYPGRFQRVLMPKGSAAEVAKSTGVFGENGYGQPSGNPIRFDRFEDTMEKVVSYNILTERDNNAVLDVFSRIRISDASFEDILGRYVTLTNDSATQSEDPFFGAACSWMRDNYNQWTNWMLTPLPLCTVEEHMVYTIAGCERGSTAREITFQWTRSDPKNNSNPFVCDGGWMTLPPPLVTSRSCEWLEANNETWLSWVAEKPSCDLTFFSYIANECGADDKRRIEFYWLLPDADNASMSHECSGDLPKIVEIDCEYMPEHSRTFFAISVMTIVLAVAIVICIFLVIKHREIAIIRRSQYEFLLTMLTGTLCICAAVILYAGEPTDGRCVARPFVISVGFTLVFGSLVVKTLRVYRIFNSKRLKRVVLPTQTMFKILGGFLLVDTVILTAWFVTDFPSAVFVAENIAAVASGAVVDRKLCFASSFIFSALLIFWKAVLLVTGLYLSFLVRKVSVDFQESIWIFASSVVVAITCSLVLPLAYLVPLAAAAFYTFFAIVLWVATLSVVALMLVPKLLRHKETSSSNTSGSSSSSDNTGAAGKSGAGPTMPEPSKRLSDGNVGAKRGPALYNSSRVSPAQCSPGKLSPLIPTQCMQTQRSPM